MASQLFDFLNTMDILDKLDNMQPIISRKIRKKRINPITALTERDFRRKYRFSKMNMRKLITLVRADLSADIRGVHIPVDLQVMAAIRYWGGNEIQHDGADIHGLSQPTLNIITTRVALAFASKSRQYVRMPQTASEQMDVIGQFKSIRGFPKESFISETT